MSDDVDLSFEALVLGADPGYTAEDNYDADLLAQLLDWEEFWQQDHEAEEWLVRPILAERRSHAIFAPGGTGKSLFSLWLAAQIATGGTAFGIPVRRRRVLYLDYEMTAEDLAERLEAMGFDSADILVDLKYALLPSLPAADTPEGGKAIVRLAQLCEAEVVILDTFSRAVEGDENDADTVRSFYRWTGINLKADGRAFVRIDHAGKDTAKGQRGTSAKNDDVDVVWQMARIDGGYRLTAKKKRMGWVPDTVDVTQSDNPLTYDMAERPGYPIGTSEMMQVLDQLGVDLDLSARKVGPIVRAAGHTVSNDVLRAAVRARREYVLTIPEPTVITPETNGTDDTKARRDGSGAPPTAPSPAHPPARVSSEGAKDQRKTRAEGSTARSGAGVESPCGAPPLSKSGAPAGPPPTTPDEPDTDPVEIELF